MYDAITDVSGIRVGHYSHFEAITGCTVVLCEVGAFIHAVMRSVQRADSLGTLPAFKDIAKY